MKSWGRADDSDAKEGVKGRTLSQENNVRHPVHLSSISKTSSWPSAQSWLANCHDTRWSAGKGGVQKDWPLGVVFSRFVYHTSSEQMLCRPWRQV